MPRQEPMNKVGQMQPALKRNPREEREVRQVVKHPNRKEKGRRNHRGVDGKMNQGNKRLRFGIETQYPAEENEYRSRVNKRPNGRKIRIGRQRIATGSKMPSGSANVRSTPPIGRDSGIN